MARKSSPEVSDHALIRFLERAYGLGEFLDEVREEIRKGVTPAIVFGAHTAIVHGARLIIVDDHVVVTALPKRKR